MYDVTAIGELLIDFTLEGSDPAGYPTLSAHPGGAPANFLAALSACGRKAAMVGKVGDDAFGRLLVATLRDAGVDTAGVVLDDRVFTTLAFVTLDSRGERDFSFARKPGADTRLGWSEVNITLVENCRDLHFGSLSLTCEPAREAVQMAVYRAKSAGRWISFDPNLRPPLWDSLDHAREQILWGMGQADIVKLSGEEGDFLWRCGPEETAGRLHDLGVKTVFVTLGGQGCLVSGGGSVQRLPALEGVRAVDATGAGDIFFGAALAALLDTGREPDTFTADDLRAAARQGAVAAGLSVQRPGGISSVPTLGEIRERLTSF